MGRDAYDLILAGRPQGPTRSAGPAPFRRQRHALARHLLPGRHPRALTFATDRAALAKAILEGLTFELRINLDLLRESGVAIDELRAVGGGARSPLWLQLKADICRMPLRVPQVTEAACLGAALLAGVACGVYPDLETAVSNTVRLGGQITPDPQSSGAYANRFETYRRIYPALKSLLKTA